MPNNAGTTRNERERRSQANRRQEGGNHYKEQSIQPWDAITDWKLGFLDGNAVKYLARWRKKGGRDDLLKARHYIDKQLEQDEAQA